MILRYDGNELLAPLLNPTKKRSTRSRLCADECGTAQNLPNATLLPNLSVGFLELIIYVRPQPETSSTLRREDGTA